MEARAFTAFTIAALVALSAARAAAVEAPELKGNTECEWGSKACNRCVEDLEAQLASLPRSSSQIQIEGKHYPSPNHFAPRLSASYEHIQGVGRLPGKGDNWFVYGVSINSTKSDARASVLFARVGQKQDTRGARFGADMIRDNNGDCSGYTVDTCPYNTNWTRNFFEGNGRFYNAPHTAWSSFPASRTDAAATRTNHVSGIQTVGRLIAVVNGCQDYGSRDWCQTAEHWYNLVIIDASEPSAPVSINRLNLKPFRDRYGSSGQSANASMVQLRDGRYLAHAYGHFFVTDGSAIDTTTTWTRVDGAPLKAPAHEYNNMAMHTNCETGDIHALPIYGRSYHYVEGLKLIDDGNGGIRYQDVGDSPQLLLEEADSQSGATLYVDPQGKLVFYATSKHQLENGNIIITEH